MVYRFGRCRLDDAARRLERDGQEQRLSKKAYALLMLLLRARPTVVTKDEIMAALWPDTFVSEANIAVLIGHVRAAVGESAGSAQVVRTHSGVGYSFCADVDEAVRAASFNSAVVATLVIGARRVVLPEGVSTVGRDQTCDIVVTHPSVSRVHARVLVERSQAHVEDAGSKNGVRVNGSRIAGRTRLPTGATLTLGSVDATFLVDEGAAGSTMTLDSLNS